ncbi:MAG TPA: PEP-CTERM/exosortase system-associated acyltransferase [Candidatus Competibacteraceae bacterium]|nr:PEP-CTERM/exosortase system-associated acyltransferase [Candidatus Competibacteraceae bacterium]HRZ07271.1 PEP-CTERM/exosortase system-associated acyltransferase [Candidatus Competibacteraceae bacterium]HSA45409.1 PEP-CTERM/exosortase system-associated acyltransferase [Candidatus Competibacteraceae bacterium]
MFDSNYEVILADTEAARATHRKVRYHVYCVERSFESPKAFPFGEEHDPWDIHAAQFIVRQRTSGKWVAAMRIVLPQAASFPLETMQCLMEPNHSNHLHRREFGEVSRICIIHSPNPNEINQHLDWSFGHVGKNGEPEVLLGLIRAGILYGLAQGIKHYYLLVTGAFARLLRRLGLVMHQTGVAIEHRGWRTPYLMDLRESVASISAKSEVIRHLFARKALAYQPFSALDDAREERVALMPHHLFPQPAAGTAWRMEVERSRLGPGAWRIETEHPKPGPGVWRIEAEYSKPGPGVWRGASVG